MPDMKALVLTKKVFAGLASLLIFGVLSARPAYAQGCALCHTQAASETSFFIAALKEGIWVLILPSLFVCTALARMAYLRRNRSNEANPEADAW